MSYDAMLPKMAGYFYPQDETKLNKSLSEFIMREPLINKKPQALIVPHAGYEYSGETAGKAYAILNNFKDDFDTVVIIGPAHHIFVDKPCVLNKDCALVNGLLKKDDIIIDELVKDGLVNINNEVHDGEHSNEVQLPFLNFINPKFKIVNILTGPYEKDNVVKLMDALFKFQRVLVIVSSDLSHFNSYESAKEIDKNTIKNILSLNEAEVNLEDACGAVGIKALIKVSKKYLLKPKVLAYCNSGDRTANKQKVVGYASFGFFNS